MEGVGRDFLERVFAPVSFLFTVTLGEPGLWRPFLKQICSFVMRPTRSPVVFPLQIPELLLGSTSSRPLSWGSVPVSVTACLVSPPRWPRLPRTERFQAPAVVACSGPAVCWVLSSLYSLVSSTCWPSPWSQGSEFPMFKASHSGLDDSAEDPVSAASAAAPTLPPSTSSGPDCSTGEFLGAMSQGL